MTRTDGIVRERRYLFALDELADNIVKGAGEVNWHDEGAANAAIRKHMAMYVCHREVNWDDAEEAERAEAEIQDDWFIRRALYDVTGWLETLRYTCQRFAFPFRWYAVSTEVAEEMELPCKFELFCPYFPWRDSVGNEIAALIPVPRDAEDIDARTLCVAVMPEHTSRSGDKIPFAMDFAFKNYPTFTSMSHFLLMQNNVLTRLFGDNYVLEEMICSVKWMMTRFIGKAEWAIEEKEEEFI